MYGGQFDSYSYSSQLVVLDPALNESCEAECFKGGPGARRSMSAAWAPWLRENVLLWRDETGSDGKAM